MILRLFQNMSDTHVVQKDIIQKAEISGTLLEDCSILDPVIATPLIAASDLKYINYAEIPDFGRYYYVTDIICRGKLFEVHMHIDVLNTYKDQIKPLSAIIARNESQYNLYLRDGLIQQYANPHIQIKQFPDGFDRYEYIFSVCG